jgi:uncharacterized membrane protein YqjE
VRLLWSLPKAAPAILRHLVAYVELAVEDLAQAQRDLGARIVASLLLGASLFFLLLIACLAVVAVTWDTPNRLSAIGWMGGAFFAAALIAGLYRSKVVNARAPFLGTVRREWAEDRVILDRILSDQD